MADFLQGIQQARQSGAASGMTRVNRHGGGSISFLDVLKSRLEEGSGINFSAHAVDRMNERGINLDNSQLTRLSDAVQRAGSKGARDSLVMMDNTAYIVSVENKTVVTVIHEENLKENVFTNIDSTVIT